MLLPLSLLGNILLLKSTQVVKKIIETNKLTTIYFSNIVKNLKKYVVYRCFGLNVSFDTQGDVKVNSKPVALEGFIRQ